MTAPGGVPTRALAETPGREALLGTYAPPAALFVSGQGSWMSDAGGRDYLDFTSGIGVVALGHGSAVVRRAVDEAMASGLVHTSNLYRTAPAEALARELVEVAFPGRVFFCNSGAEANEAAFKFVRKRARALGGADKHGIVAFRGSFHGRLFGSLAATDRPDYRAAFEPLMPGVSFADVGDLESVEILVSDRATAAVIIEPVQGEGGVRPVPDDFLRALRRLCDERRVSLIFDEVQCGLGRTGRLFAGEHAGVTPDVLTLAKPLAGGFPMGAVLAAPSVAEHVAPGDHATTFGGGPVVAHVARAVLATVSDPDFLDSVRRKGADLEARLRQVARRVASVREVRGRGLMWGLAIEGSAGDVVTRARDAGLLVVGAGPDVVRLLPPLTVTDDELAQGVELPGGVLAVSGVAQPRPDHAFRPARPGDVDQMAALINGYAAQGLMLPKSVSELHRLFREYVVVVQDDRVVGCGGLRVYRPGLAEIVGLAVREEWQGRGLGGSIVRWLLDEADRLGIPQVFAMTLEEGFFHRKGFRTIQREWLPEKIAADCRSCARRAGCGEIAVYVNLGSEAPRPVLEGRRLRVVTERSSVA